MSVLKWLTYRRLNYIDLTALFCLWKFWNDGHYFSGVAAFGWLDIISIIGEMVA